MTTTKDGMAVTATTTYSTEVIELTQWLTRQIDEKCTRVTLRQRLADGGEQGVRDWPLRPDVDVTDLARAIDRTARDDGRHFQGRTLYAVFAFRENEYVDRMFLSVQGDETLSRYAANTELGNLSNVTTQLMRHNEANARLAVGQTIDVIRHYKMLLDARERRIEELEARYFEVLDLYEKLTTLQHERDLELLKAEKAGKQQDRLWEKLEMLLPVLASKFMPSAKGSAILGEELLRQFLGSLTEEQMAQIFGALAPEQAALIQEVYLAYGRREVSKQAKKNGAANGKHADVPPSEST